MNNDNTLHHSNEAISVTSQFYGKKFMLYVEGDDDIAFWDERFQKVVSSNIYEIEQVHGKENLPQYIDGIKNGTIDNAIVACDSDYINYVDSKDEHCLRVIYTYGHSIENSMFCPYNVATYAKRLSRTHDDFLQIITEWYNQFCASSLKLLPYEIINYLKDLAGSKDQMTSFFSDNCCRFLKDGESSLLDDSKIDSFIDKHQNEYDKNEVENIIEKIQNDSRQNQYKIKGHFITNGVMNEIRKITKENGHETKLEKKQLYAALCTCLNSCKDCQDYAYISQQIKDAYHSFNIN